MSNTLTQHFATSTREAAKYYAKDLAAMTHEALNSPIGGHTRCGFDFTEEVIVVNHRIAARLRGNDPGAWPYEGWVTAPEEHKNKDEMANRLIASADDVAGALEALQDADLGRTFTAGEKESKLADIAGMPAYHMGYHDGQLNLIQAFHGDEEVHWM